VTEIWALNINKMRIFATDFCCLRPILNCRNSDRLDFRINIFQRPLLRRILGLSQNPSESRLRRILAHFVMDSCCRKHRIF